MLIVSESTLTERRAFIRSFVKEVTVTEKEVVLTYTMPLPSEAIIEEQSAVPSIVHHGGQYWI